MILKELLVFSSVFLLLIFVRFVNFFGTKQLPILPGDISLKKFGLEIYLPLTSTIILSIIISLIINAF